MKIRVYEGVKREFQKDMERNGGLMMGEGKKGNGNPNMDGRDLGSGKSNVCRSFKIDATVPTLGL